jgi:hypothetical protein
MHSAESIRITMIIPSSFFTRLEISAFTDRKNVYPFNPVMNTSSFSIPRLFISDGNVLAAWRNDLPSHTSRKP